MAIQIQIRRDIAANWTATNPILADGEEGYETDTAKLKFGDGVTVWTGLPYFSGVAGGGYTIVNVNFAASPYTIIPIANEYIYLVDATGGNVIINFPTAIGNTASYTVKKIDATANTVTLDPFGAQTLDGSATKGILFQNTSVDIYSDNANLLIK